MDSSSRPEIHLKSPTFRSQAGNDTTSGEAKPSRRRSTLKRRKAKHLRIADPSSSRQAANHGVYLGSYAASARSSPRGSGNVSRTSTRASTSHVQLEHLLQAMKVDLETYGVEELRDGFFDASFHQPLKRNHDDLLRKARYTLPDSFKLKNQPLSFRRFLPQQLHEAKSFLHQVSSTRAGIRLLKSFFGVFITYIICLIPASRDWLGRYNYIMVISAIVNHSGRAIGSQLDGAVLTIIGTVAGLGWGSLALYVSTATPTARSGYGGILAAFLVIFTVLIGWLRCVFLRFYQAVLASGFAIFYTCLADTAKSVGWVKVFDYGIPWVLGQTVCLIVSICVFPDAGSRSLTLAFHDSLQTVLAGLTLPRVDSPTLKQRLALQFVRVSQRVRDFTIEFTISRFSPDDVRSVRNLIQAVDRSILAIKPDTALLAEPRLQAHPSPHASLTSLSGVNESKAAPVHLICDSLQKPTRKLIDSMIEAVKQIDFAILHVGGRKMQQDPGALLSTLESLQTAKAAFDSADALLVGNPDLPSMYQKSAEVIELFLFVHPVRQTADKVEALGNKVQEMQSTKTQWKIRPPSYPFYKAIMRSNAQVRHDRGGLTAGFYFRSKRQLDRTMADLQSTAYIPAARHENTDKRTDQDSVMGEYQQEQEMASGNARNVSKLTKYRYHLWEVLHRLQGFESRFAFKVTLVSTLLSVPAWLPQSRDWWNDYESWWTVVTVWTMMHPRVGGTFQDLAVRAFCAALGALWAGLAYAADNGNPYVMAVFAAIYLVPMLHRFTQSAHPRSGIIGCISFTVVSLSAYTEHGQPSIVTFAWTRGLAFIVGVVAALITNWILWPFIARHELRKSLSSMLIHCAIIYRGVVAKYIYYLPGEEPGPGDIERSETLEGRLREGFVRMRQLLELTRHEMRLRAPFNPLPYSALINACESFFEHLVQVRQSSLYFQPSILASDTETVESLTAPRRDAVAVILLNLYIFASALRADQPVPRYLPSAAAARRKLLDRMEILEAEQAKKMEAETEVLEKGKGKECERKNTGLKRRWADVYQYAFSQNLTDIVEQVQVLQRYTKEICGEAVWGDETLVAE
ncbi:Zinc finger protein [Lecanora helva]